MTESPRALIMLSMSLLLLGPMDPAFSDTHDKENSAETPTPRPQRPPTASDGQPTPSKPPTDAKPQSSPAPTTKTDTSTDHKEVAPEKPAPPKSSTEGKSQSAPATKSDTSTDHKEVTPEKHTPPKSATDGKPQSPSAPATKTDTSTDHKEVAPEKPAPPKSATDGKPQSPSSPPTKTDSTDHKEVSPEKHAPAKPQTDGKAQSAPAPATKADSQPAESEGKEKDQTAKKPLGSLILSVKLALMGDSRLFRYEIEVEDDQQTVTLTGRVSAEEEKAAAMEIAQAVPGVKAVVNKLAVEKDLAKTLLKKQDEILTGLIKERFSKSATLKAANFEVKTEDGVVQLNGTVRFQVIALEAAEAARQVPGVRAVNTEKIRLEGES